MGREVNSKLHWSAILGMIACGSLMLPVAVRAQVAVSAEKTGGWGSIGHTARNVAYGLCDSVEPVDQDAAAANDQTASQGVVRLARFLTVRGNVTWRADDGLDWSQAVPNLPLRQGAQIQVQEGGRAELQFDDGSVLRLGHGAVVTLKTLYSDDQGEFSELTLSAGLVTLRAKHDHSVYRVDTPMVSLTTRGPSRTRVGVDDGVEVAVHAGEATVEGNNGKVKLSQGDYLDLTDANAAYVAVPVPGSDSWDHWNDERDRALDGDVTRPSARYLPSNVAIAAPYLDDYGVWRDDPQYGHVWCPRGVDADWRPYHNGHWTWVNPFGWTWVADEPWGWAPYHYGTWVSGPYGWAWVPGPVNQYWSPAVVNFCELRGTVAWVPLAPAEVRYPAVLSVGFRSGGGWGAFFSIGAAAVYYPAGPTFVVARPFNTTYVNHVTFVNNVTVVNNISRERVYNSSEFFAVNHNTYVTNNAFVPINARLAAGVSSAPVAGFGSRAAGAYEAVPKASSVNIFTTGRSIGAPSEGGRPVAGPASVAPTRESLTPNRSFVSSSTPSSLSRSVFHAPLPASVSRQALAPIAPNGTRIPVPTRAATASNPTTGRQGTTTTAPGRPTSGSSAADAARAAREALNGGSSREGSAGGTRTSGTGGTGDNTSRTPRTEGTGSSTSTPSRNNPSTTPPKSSGSGSSTSGGSQGTRSGGYHNSESGSRGGSSKESSSKESGSKDKGGK